MREGDSRIESLSWEVYCRSGQEFYQYHSGNWGKEDLCKSFFYLTCEKEILGLWYFGYKVYFSCKKKESLENSERVEGQEFYGRGELKYHGGNRGKEDLGNTLF